MYTVQYTQQRKYLLGMQSAQLVLPNQSMPNRVGKIIIKITKCVLFAMRSSPISRQKIYVQYISGSIAMAAADSLTHLSWPIVGCSPVVDYFRFIQTGAHNCGEISQLDNNNIKRRCDQYEASSRSCADKSRKR